MGTASVASGGSRNQMNSVLDAINQGSTRISSPQNQMLKLMKAATTGGQASIGGGSGALVSDISATRKLIQEVLSELCNLKRTKKRYAARNMDGSGKMRRLMKKIKKKHQMIKTLEATLDTQKRQLHNVNEAAAATANYNNDESDDYSDGGIDSSDDDDDYNDDGSNSE